MATKKLFAIDRKADQIDIQNKPAAIKRIKEKFIDLAKEHGKFDRRRNLIRRLRKFPPQPQLQKMKNAPQSPRSSPRKKISRDEPKSPKEEIKYTSPSDIYSEPRITLFPIKEELSDHKSIIFEQNKKLDDKITELCYSVSKMEKSINHKLAGIEARLMTLELTLTCFIKNEDLPKTYQQPRDPRLRFYKD